MALSPSWQAASAQQPLTKWDAMRGDWQLSAVGGKASGKGPQGAILVSQDWYGRLAVSGSLRRSGDHDRRAAILVRYAAGIESYALVVDWSNGKIGLEESHFGATRTLLSLPVDALARTTTLHFRIATERDALRAAFWPEHHPETAAVRLEYGALQVPEGRFGFDARSGELAFTSLEIEGETKSSYEIYAFHCNYRLKDKVAHQPLWQYLDAVGSSLTSRYPRDFRTVAEFEKHRAAAVLRLRHSLGLDPWPARTALNARVVGSVDRPDVRIEKVIFESQPGFLVSALLYVPKKLSGRAPAILSAIGHWGEDDFYLWMEQARCMGLARKGYVVLTYDPISQGERHWLGNGNHDMLRRKIILAGMEVSGLMMWDSIRAIDYLVSRPEVDPEKIGITGVSGGGFNSLYTAVLDQRIKAAAPDGFATSVEALIKRANAGCCAYLPNLNRYAEFDDIYSFIAPRKLLILGGYMDILSDRILSNYEVARKAYRLYGAEDSAGYFLDRDAGHSFSKPMRLAMYRFFNKWLKGTEDPAEAREPRDPEDFLLGKDSGLLRVFAPGQKGRDVTDLMREYLAQHQVKHPKLGSAAEASAYQQQLKETLVELMGDMEPARAPVVVRDDPATTPEEPRTVVLRTERNLTIPVRIFRPGAPRRDNTLIVYFTMSDRQPVADLTATERIRRLVATGYTVAAPEVRGSGASRVEDMNSVMLYSMALGKHLFSSRIWDLQRVLDYLLAQEDFRSRQVVVLGEGSREGVMALYLAAIDPRVQTAVSLHGLISYQDVVDKNGTPDFDYYVPGLLRHADVPQIIGAIAPRRVLISAPVDIEQRIAGRAEAEKAYTWARDVYQALGRQNEFSIVAEADLLAAVSQTR
jgi:dienelactone hydrolase